MSIKEIKACVGEDFEVQTRSNGQVCIGVATSKLSSTNDEEKFNLLRDAYDKLKAQGLIPGEFGEVFKAGNPPMQGSKLVHSDGRETKAPWRIYFQLLFTPEAQAASKDPGPEYLKVLLAAGYSAPDAMAIIRGEKAAPKPETTAAPEGVVDGDTDEDIPV